MLAPRGHFRGSQRGGAVADSTFTHLVVVGSSAGGIRALSGMVSSLPEDFDAPIVVAQHLDPNRESHLQDILARKSTLPVKTVTEHEPLQAGMVFVVPANRHVNITDSEIDLSSEPLSGQPMPSINLLMETAAGVYGENLIAVVLSGTGTDGTEGARTVSQAGGTVIIQDPDTAEFGEMPRSLAAGTPYDLEFRITTPGGVRWVHLKGRVHTDEAGASTRVLGIMLDITEMKRAERASECLRSLEAGASAEAAERERISRELHDRVAHSMGVAHQSLQFHEALVEKDPERAHGKLRTAQEMTKLALEQTRNLSMELRRSETENGLLPALQDLIEVAVPDDISTNLSSSGAESLLPDHQRGQLYLILREAIRNAVRHSGCRHLTVGVDITPEEVSGYVEDDGRGFEDNGNGSLGLRSIKERAALLDGTARVYSSPQGGAGVRVLLPLLGGGR